MKILVLAALLGGCGRSSHVVALVDSAAITVERNDPQGLAHIDAAVDLFTTGGHDHVVLGGGHLTGESWYDYVQFLQLDFVNFDGALSTDGERVALVNHTVANHALLPACDLQLNFGITVVSERHDGDLAFSDRWPVRIDCR